jgi:hypothetical protein
MCEKPLDQSLFFSGFERVRIARGMLRRHAATPDRMCC